MKRILRYGAVAVMAFAFTNCNLYKKYELPTDASQLVDDYSKALDEKPDSTTLPYLGWK